MAYSIPNTAPNFSLTHPGLDLHYIALDPLQPLLHAVLQIRAQALDFRDYVLKGLIDSIDHLVLLSGDLNQARSYIMQPSAVISESRPHNGY